MSSGLPKRDPNVCNPTHIFSTLASKTSFASHGKQTFKAVLPVLAGSWASQTLPSIPGPQSLEPDDVQQLSTVTMQAKNSQAAKPGIKYWLEMSKTVHVRIDDDMLRSQRASCLGTVCGFVQITQVLQPSSTLWVLCNGYIHAP